MGTGTQCMQVLREWLKARHVGQAFQPAIAFPEVRSLKTEDLEVVAFTRRNLPHWELEGSTNFLTFRIRTALGKALEREPLACIVEEALWFGHADRYLLDAYVIMPDHVHLLLRPLPGWGLCKILQGIKGYTAREINRALGRKGAFWQDESFDHLVRNDRDWLDKFNYIHNNPVSSKLVARPQDYPYGSMVTMHSKGRPESLPHICNRFQSAQTNENRSE